MENIQSQYKYGAPKFPLLPILHGLQQNYQYDEPLHPCTVGTFTSSLIEETIGEMETLDNYPVFCVFTLQRSSNVTSISQVDVNLF